MGDMNLELLLGMAYGHASGGSGSGGTGTTNYAALTNKPKINNVTLDGNRSLSDLGIENYDDTVLSGRVSAVETALSGKANTADLADVATSGSYNDLDDKPTIPSAYDDTALTGRVSALETDVNDLKTNGASVTVDATLSDTSENPVQNKAIKAALDGLSVSGVVVDTALSDTSENPVQNKVIKAALDGKANSTDIPAAYDDTEIKTALASKTNDADLATVAKSGAYNDLTGLPTIPAETPIATQTVAGKVKAGNGVTISADGTLSVQTPSEQGYVDSTTIMDYNDETHSIDKWDSADTAKANKESIVLPEWALQSEVDAVVNGGGQKNLIKQIKFTNDTYTSQGITYTINADGSITANGTATATSSITFAGINLEYDKDYILSGSVGGSSSTYYILVAGTTAGSFVARQYDDEITYKRAASTGDTKLRVMIQIESGTTVNNVTFYPMLRDAAIKDDTYVPYAMSNAQITEELSDTGWVLFAVDETGTEATGEFQYRKKNGWVCINTNCFIVKQKSNSNWSVIGKVPDAIKPTSNVFATVVIGANTAQIMSKLYINSTNGEVNVMPQATTAANAPMRGSIVYPI